MRGIRRGFRIWRTAVELLGTIAAAAGTAASAQAWADANAKPARIVSLDLCTDQLLIELAESNRIAAVTHLAAAPLVSAVAAQARALPVTRGGAEDVLRHRPDLVLAGPYGVGPTVNLLRRLKANVVVVPMASDLDGVRDAVRAVATAVGEPARGQALLAEFDRRLASLPPTRGHARPTAIVYQVGGVVSVTGSLADAALAAAGLRNKASELKLTRTGQLPLELLASAPPDLLVLTSAAEEFPTVVSDNLRHPVLHHLRRRIAAVEVPWRLWLCGTPHIADAITRLGEARAAIEARRP